jgi:hypothetical protein
MRKTKYACRKEAKKVVKRIQDYLTEGYTIIGILGEMAALHAVLMDLGSDQGNYLKF